MSDPIPNDQQRTELCRLLYHAFIQIRFYGYHGKTVQMTDLADAIHNLPIQMIGDQDFNWDRIRADVDAYQKKYSGDLSGMDLVLEIDRIRKLEPGDRG